ncbi:FMN-binding negative transcriptional regulator [Nocardioides renjunii]|uniref:FMN-binding negative transcriptional regulator n=1 Tax=Nocardioides renjunii TaxID=3095075 RepID=UPI002AFE992E|nr:FMN-binding negative transcriptional regulator [Nocardioides sp. S-34]WQQ20695.1 FMN-binding negative transcriptional regulator [Nocardioides sp. S-34]
MTDPQLYVPRFNVMDPDDVRGFVHVVAAAQLVTVGEDGQPDATFFPVLWEGDRLVGHQARANPHWRRIVTGSPALAVVTGPDTYVSPSWYAAKAEHGKVVPTWNYSVVHLRGRVTVHDDPDWVRALVTRLTDRHEERRADRWRVTDAPEDYVTKNLRPIVGVELVVESVEAKAKLSQNRSDADRAGVAAGLAADGADPAGLVAP